MECNDIVAYCSHILRSDGLHSNSFEYNYILAISKLHNNFVHFIQCPLDTFLRIQLFNVASTAIQIIIPAKIVSKMFFILYSCLLLINKRIAPMVILLCVNPHIDLWPQV